jgi:hypothetical protein
MDVASLSKSGMLHEFEVKISRSDFMADKKKKVVKFSHYDMKNEKSSPNYFYYVCPEGLIKPDEIPVYAGLYYCNGEDIELIKNAKRIHKAPGDIQRILKKMLRLNIQRQYLGGSMLTFLHKKAKERLIEWQNNHDEANY